MAIKIECDLCGRTVKRVSGRDANEWLNKKDVWCKFCTRKQDDLLGFFKTKRDAYYKKIDRLHEEAKQALLKEIKALAVKEYEKEEKKEIEEIKEDKDG